MRGFCFGGFLRWAFAFGFWLFDVGGFEREKNCQREIAKGKLLERG
jgi:hypothetical protein